MSQRSMCWTKTNPGAKLAILEIGKGRGRGEAASKRADAAFPTIEGRRDVEFTGFRRHAIKLQRVASPGLQHQLVADDLESEVTSSVASSSGPRTDPPSGGR
jgi:hypothetical protein